VEYELSVGMRVAVNPGIGQIKNICGGKMLELEFWNIYFLERCSLTDMQCCTLIERCMPYKNWGLGAIGISSKGVVCSVCWFCGVNERL
jgi:hypothetical protein